MSFSFSAYQNDKINDDDAFELAMKNSLATGGTTNSTVKRAQAYFNSEQGCVKKQKHLQNSSRTVELFMDSEESLKQPAKNDNDVGNSKLPAWTQDQAVLMRAWGNGVDFERDRPFGNDDNDLQMENACHSRGNCLGDTIPTEISFSSNVAPIDKTATTKVAVTSAAIGGGHTQSNVSVINFFVNYLLLYYCI